ncbi:MAG: hypothetical protein H0W03_08180, partial [Solirubrobacterales bacterium]|nr:hypothetical protein [Solirubrobacterales bacterium]
MRQPASSPSLSDGLAGRVGPAALLALAAFAVGAALGGAHVPPEREVAQRYLTAWQRGDHATMHGLLTPDARRAVGPQEFRAVVRGATTTATATGLEFDDLELDDGALSASATVPTRIFGELALEVRLAVEEVDGEQRIAWRLHHAFPGLRPGERLSRATQLPERGALLARDGTQLAAGPLRTSQLGVA